jgi:hypothetical protein
MFKRIVDNWVYGGALAGVLLLLLAPVLTASWPIALTVTFLHLPAYMLHQYEEHDNDRFRLFLNATVGQGREVLSRFAVFIINIPGVWGVIALSLALAWGVHIGYALIAVYLILVNAVAHVGHSVAFHRYNPGLATAIVIFVPLGACTLYRVQAAGGGTAAFHAIGLLSAIAIHGAIVLHVVRRRR